MPWIVKPTVNNPALQRAIDDLAGRFSEVLSRDGRVSEVVLPKVSASAIDACSSPKRLKLSAKEDLQGENGVTKGDFRYTLPNKKTTDLPSASEGGPDKENKEERDSSIASVASADDSNYMKIDVERDVGSYINTTPGSKRKTLKGKHLPALVW